MEKEPPSKEKLRVEEEDDDEGALCDTVVASCAGGAEPLDEFEEIKIKSEDDAKRLMKGLTTAQAVAQREKYGLNAIPKKIVHWYTILLKQLTSSMAIMIEMAMLLALAVQEYEDFAIIAVLLTINVTIGFYEEFEALKKVEGIKSALAPMTTVKRDGEFNKLPTSALVPGDVIYLRGGDSIPADIDYLDGDTMSVDTAALTGEPFPRKVPNSKGNRRTLAGCMTVSGNTYCLVQRTGIFTEMGSATLLMQQSTKPTQSVFERSIIECCELVMTIALAFLIAVFIFMYCIKHEELLDTLTTILSILIASVPVALPVVMQVTLALGAGEMAKQQAIVTHLTAMQEIASMNVLCSDKTGTLTTAKIQVFFDKIWTAPGYTKEEIMEFCALASNPHATDDPIDIAILQSFKVAFPDDFDARIKKYTVTKFVGFVPETKRTVAYATIQNKTNLKVSKGLIDKILDTGDDGGDMWKCINTEKIRDIVEKIDEDFGKAGYKTLGIAVAKNYDGKKQNMEFAGIIPMLDPPRDDTKWVIEQINLCGIDVKMITGDHQNIAAETARLIGLGDEILHREKLTMRESDEKDELIKKADGFAQVMPRDKNDIVRILQTLNYIVGMTGDGVNDAPALKQAHIGIAVEGATDAARSAADIILTTEGLAPIFTAVLESRKIFQRVYSYVLYRLSATIQIVLVLSILIFSVNQTIKALYIILLALFNDLTMITISYDNVVPSRSPDQPTINKLLRGSCSIGLLMTITSLSYFYYGRYILPSSSEFRKNSGYTQSLMYLQISISIENLIFITRTPEAPFFSSKPVSSLLFSVVFANVAVTLLVCSGLIGTSITIADALNVLGYDIVVFVIIDLLKIPFLFSIENCFPPPATSLAGTRTKESEAAHRVTVDEPHTLSLPNLDTGAAFFNDVGSMIGNTLGISICQQDTTATSSGSSKIYTKN